MPAQEVDVCMTMGLPRLLIRFNAFATRFEYHT